MSNHIKSQFLTVSIRTFVETYTPNKTLIVDSIQRGDVWKKENKQGVKDAILNNMTPTPVILADIESSMRDAQLNNNIEDYNQLYEWYTQGFRFISIDGGNRSRYMNEVYDEIDNFKNLPEKTLQFLSHLIQVAIYSNLTIKEMHQMAILVNLGVPWNKAEMRNALPGFVPKFIRECVKETNEVFESYLSPRETKRKKADELVGYFLAYHQSRPDTLNQKNLDSLYTKNNVERKEEFEKILGIWKKVVSQIMTKGNKVSKPFASNLFFFLSDMIKLGYSFDQNKVEEFSELYVEKEGERITRTFDPIFKKSAWRNLDRYAKNYHAKVETIYRDLKSNLGDFFILKDKNRVFSPEDKIEKMIQSQSMITNLDGTSDRITILQALNGNLIHGDHIHPHVAGGKTDVDNLQLLTKKDNLKKSDKIQ